MPPVKTPRILVICIALAPLIQSCGVKGNPLPPASATEIEAEKQRATQEARKKARREARGELDPSANPSGTPSPVPSEKK